MVGLHGKVRVTRTTLTRQTMRTHVKELVRSGAVQKIRQLLE